ncbi:MAG: LAGLIDADG family homing endonuclease, partial [Nitrososphaerales archaeon]
KEYVQYKGYEGCAKCPLFSICLTDAKKQTSKSPMLKTLDELIQKVRAEGPEWALAQLMNLKPSVEGIIYREFDEKIHVKTWNEMWYILTGKEFPGHCTHDIFVKKCFSEDTEVLTQNGFKLFKDLTPYDKIASLDDEGKLIYEKPLDYISYHYRGAAYNLYNRIGGHGKQLDLLMTEDHNQVYVDPHDLYSGNIRYKKDKIQNLIDKRFYVPAVPLVSEFSSTGYSPISYMTPEQYASFMGLWLSEGSCASERSNKKFRHNAVTVSQRKPDNVAKIDALLSSIKWPSKLHKTTDKRDMSVTWAVYNKELYDHVKRWRYAVNKSIDRAFFDKASKKQMELMLEWLMLGDGSEYKQDPKQQPYYGTGSEKLANDVQELCFRLGYRTNLTYKYNRPVKHSKNGTESLRMFRVQIHTKRSNNGSKYWYISNGKNVSEFSGKRTHNIDKTQYDGNVYCVTMPSGRLFVRRNGVIALSGNCHEMQLPCYAGIDWGFSSPNTVVFFFMDKRENVYVVRTDGMTHISTPAWIHHIKTKYHNMYRVQLYVPDQADQGAIQEMQKAGLPVSNTAKKDPIMVGIQVIKKLLKVPGSAEAKLFLNKETCSHIISEFSLYHYKLDAAGLVTDDPDTENDHWLDALRYPLTLLLGKTNIILGGGLEYDSMQGLVDSQGSYHRTPTAAEFAAVNGIKFNDIDEDVSKLGKIGTKQELDDDDDSGSSSQGGFIWSF